jgi:hypothetical protein
MTRYYRRPWHETRGDDHDDWGTSEWYFEVGDDGWVSRQVEIYENGPTLRYDEGHIADEYGLLAEKPLPLDDFAPYEISADDFELVWQGEDGAANATPAPSPS